MYINALNLREHRSKFKLTKGTPYLILTGKLFGVSHEDFSENQPCYEGTALHRVPGYGEVWQICCWSLSDGYKLANSPEGTAQLW